MSRDEQRRCPQCKNPIAEDAEQCPICGFWLMTETPAPKAEPEELPPPEKAPVPPARIGDYLEQDILAYWNGGWGDKMLPLFRQLAAGKNAFSLTGLLFPSIWLAFRKKWSLSLAVTLLVCGVPMVLHGLLYPLLGSDPGMLSAVETFITLGISFGLSCFLPRWFWKDTQRALDSLGCRNRVPGEGDRAMAKKLTEQGGCKPLNLLLGMLLFFGVTYAFLPLQAVILKLFAA